MSSNDELGNIVDNEIQKSGRRLADWETRLTAHALALHRGLISQDVYHKEVEQWRNTLQREIRALHLNCVTATGGNSSDLCQQEFKLVSRSLEHRLHQIDSLAENRLSRPAQEIYRSNVEESQEIEALLRGVKTSFAQARREWDESKHPRDHLGQFSHTDGGQKLHGFLRPLDNRDSSIEEIKSVFAQGPLIPANHKSARDARESILEIDKEYKKRYYALRKRGEEIFERITRVENLSKNYSQKTHIPSHLQSQYEQLQEEETIIDLERYKLSLDLRRSVWNQIAISKNSAFQVDLSNFANQDKIACIDAGVKILSHLVSERIVKDNLLRFENITSKNSAYRLGIISVGIKMSVPLFCHEVGHHLEESYPELGASLVRYRDSRIKSRGLDLNRPTRMNGYQGNVLGFPDVFFDNYFSRVYPFRSSTEILSLGLEYLVGDTVTLAESDEDLFSFIYNVNRGILQ